MNENQIPVEPDSLTTTLIKATPTLDAVWKLCIIFSVVLYAIGLVISNYHIQRYGRESLDLIKAEYIIVGLLWSALSFAGFSMWQCFRRVWQSRVRENFDVVETLWGVGGLVLIGVLLFFAFNMFATNLMPSATLYSRQQWIVLVVLVGTGAAIDYFIRNLREVHEGRVVGLASFFEGWYFIHLARYGSGLFLALLAYASVVFPLVPKALGGGRMHRAEFFLQDAKREVYKSFGIVANNEGSLGQWEIVTELSDAFVVTRKTGSQSETIWVRKDTMALVKYLNDDPIEPPVSQPQP